MSNIKLGIVGVGKIVRDQHLPSIEKNGGYDLIATASRNAAIDNVPAFKSIGDMLDMHPEIEAVALCMPAQYRYAIAKFAISKGVHVLLEKPPGSTVSEVEQLADMAKQNGVCVYTTWHSRHANAVGLAKEYLSNAAIQSASVTWKENVKKWHPGQEWIWQAGGLGVFDPGINGLSILTEIFPVPIYAETSVLAFPENKLAPIAAELAFRTEQGAPISLDFDWRVSGEELWDIEVKTDSGTMLLANGGARLFIDGQQIDNRDGMVVSEHGEYEAIYQRFAEVVHNKCSDVDLTPLKLVADSFLLAERQLVSPFED